MFKNKHELPGITSLFFTRDIITEVSSSLALRDIAKFLRTSKSNYLLFKPVLDKASALTYVAEGNPEELIRLVKNSLKSNPALLFEKGTVKDPYGHIIYDVSAFQLMIFLFDAGMKLQIMPFIPDDMQPLRDTQYAEVDCGGNDLIKMSKDPILIASSGFHGITEFNMVCDLEGKGDNVTLTIPLLENPDGIIYYQDSEGLDHFFYANKKTQTVQLIDLKTNSEEEKRALETFKASFSDMEDNSGRRSSDVEYQLIKQIMRCELIRKGIRYEKEGVSYRDSRIGFSLIDAYRAFIRLFEDALVNNQWVKAHDFWRNGVGKSQRELMWVLQRLCEKKKPDDPCHSNFYGCNRGFEIFNFYILKQETLLVGGKLSDSLGSHFAVNEGFALDTGGGSQSLGLGRVIHSALFDLLLLVKRAKADVVEINPEQNLDTVVIQP